MSDDVIELNDSEILRLEKVVKILNERKGKSLPLEAFRKEAEERFYDAGFKVEVKVWSTDVEGVYAFDLEIRDRLEGEFDPDKQVHEVTNDLLNLGEKGVIKTEMNQTASGLHIIGKH